MWIMLLIAGTHDNGEVEKIGLLVSHLLNQSLRFEELFLSWVLSLIDIKSGLYLYNVQIAK